jgi:hypothetical protein
VIVGAVAVLSHDDDGGKDKQKDEGAAQSDPKHKRHHHEEPPPPVFVADNVVEPPTTYVYRITLNFQRLAEDTTQVRVSMQGTEYHGSEIVRTGPVEDPGFFERFYAALDRSMSLEPVYQPAGLDPGD